MKYLMVGSWYVDKDTGETVYNKEWYRQGFVYKDEEAFLTDPNKCCYIAEDDYPDDEKHYTRTDILRICEGDLEKAKTIFYLLDWQHPETLYDELVAEKEW